MKTTTLKLKNFFLHFRLRPFAIVNLFIIVFAICGVPIAYVFHRQGLFFILINKTDEHYVFVAYFWTILTYILFWALAMILGTKKNLTKFMDKPFVSKSNRFYIRFWWLSFSVSIALTCIMFVQAGNILPILKGLGADFTSSGLLRTKFRFLINQNLFNVNLYLIGLFNVILSILFIRRYKILYCSISLLNILLICSFNFSKYHLAAVICFVFIFSSFFKPIRLKLVLAGAIMLLVALWPLYSVSGIQENIGQNFVRSVRDRILYGQWAGLPYFFDIFENNPQSLLPLLPPYLKPDHSYFDYEGIEAPARKVMRKLVGDEAIERGTAGVAVTFFIGEGYAVYGEKGVILAIIIVSIQFWLLCWCFSRLRKSLFTVFLYSWFLLKLILGLLTGASAFLISSFTLMLGILIYLVLALEMVKGIKKVRFMEN